LSQLFSRLAWQAMLQTVNKRQQLSQNFRQTAKADVTVGCPYSFRGPVRWWHQHVDGGKRNVVLVLGDLRRNSMPKASP
jgi:hypothetical protein